MKQVAACWTRALLGQLRTRNSARASQLVARRKRRRLSVVSPFLFVVAGRVRPSQGPYSLRTFWSEYSHSQGARLALRRRAGGTSTDAYRIVNNIQTDCDRKMSVNCQRIAMQCIQTSRALRPFGSPLEVAGSVSVCFFENPFISKFYVFGYDSSFGTLFDVKMGLCLQVQ